MKGRCSSGFGIVIKIEVLLLVRLKWQASESIAEKGPEKSQFNYFIFKETVQSNIL